MQHQSVKERFPPLGCLGFVARKGVISVAPRDGMRNLTMRELLNLFRSSEFVDDIWLDA
jgi:hypothetical protein